MEEFGAPSFSLGIEELHDTLHSEGFHQVHCPTSSRLDSGKSSIVSISSSPDDSNSELPQRIITSALRRLKRGSQRTTSTQHEAQDNSSQGSRAFKRLKLRREEQIVDAKTTLQDLWGKLESKTDNEGYDKNPLLATCNSSCNDKKDMLNGFVATETQGHHKSNSDDTVQRTTSLSTLFSPATAFCSGEYSQDKKLRSSMKEKFTNFSSGFQVKKPHSSWNLEHQSTTITDGDNDRQNCLMNQRISNKSFYSSGISFPEDPADRNSVYQSSGIHSTDKSTKPSQTKASALMSFWKSLNEKEGGNDGKDDAVSEDKDSIEECSSDDAFQHSQLFSQHGRKLSLHGNVSVAGSFTSPSVSVSESFQTQSTSFGMSKCTKDTLNFKERTNYRGFECSAKWAEKNAFIQPNDISKRESFVTMDDHHDSGISCFTKDPKNFNDSNIGSFRSSDPRVQDLLQHRFPYFIPVNDLQYASEHMYIDYENQFTSGRKAVGTQTCSNSIKQARSVVTGHPQASQRKERSNIAADEGWMRPHSSAATQPRQKKKTSKPWAQPHIKKSVNAENIEGDYEAGHWVTEKTGKRIYITKDGRKLSGSSAYRQHLKDSGKRGKKTKRRRSHHIK